MSEKILEERGLFWWHDEKIPKRQFAPNGCVAGTLTLDEDGTARLELDGYLANRAGPMGALVDRGDVFPAEKGIQGKLKGSNQNVLLFNLCKDGEGFSTNGMSHEGYIATTCLVTHGAFPPAHRPLQFGTLNIGLKGLEEWLRLGNIEVKRTRSRISARHSLPKPITYDLEDGTLSIGYDISGISSTRVARRVDTLNLIESATLRYKPKRVLSLEEVTDEYALMQDLFILLTGSDYSLEWPWLTIGRTSYRLYFYGHQRIAETPKRHECWTNFVQLRASFGEVVNIWRRKRKEFGPGIHLYLGLRRGMKMYLEHRFVNLIWGLESLHRKKGADASRKAKVEERVQRILNQIEEKKDHEWLEGRLKNAAEPTLQERLVEIFSILPFGFDIKQLRKFCETCAQRRNDISHFGGQRDNGDYHDFIMDLGRKSDALDFLYHAVLLLEIGVDTNLLKNYVFNGPHSFHMQTVFRRVELLPQVP